MLQHFHFTLLPHLLYFVFKRGWLKPASWTWWIFKGASTTYGCPWVWVLWWMSFQTTTLSRPVVCDRPTVKMRRASNARLSNSHTSRPSTLSGRNATRTVPPNCTPGLGWSTCTSTVWDDQRLSKLLGQINHSPKSACLIFVLRQYHVPNGVLLCQWYVTRAHDHWRSFLHAVWIVNTNISWVVTDISWLYISINAPLTQYVHFAVQMW